MNWRPVSSRNFRNAHSKKPPGSTGKVNQQPTSTTRGSSRMRRTFALQTILFCAIVSLLETRSAPAAPHVGIDTSHYQGTINWTSVAGAGKDFAWTKADEGATNTFNDSPFVANMTNGHNAGL